MPAFSLGCIRAEIPDLLQQIDAGSVGDAPHYQ